MCFITFLKYENSFSVFKGHRLISDQGYCKHSNGKYVVECLKSQARVLSACEADCTASDSCIGFFFGGGYCILIPSAQSCQSSYLCTCPNGFSFKGGSSYSIVETTDDIVEYPLSDHWCYVKNEGINN